MFDLIGERYERKAIAATGHRAFEEWAGTFGSGLLASTALGRPTHHCHTVVVRGQSYRQRGRRTEDQTSKTEGDKRETLASWFTPSQ